jgi:hypothetical protein
MATSEPAQSVTQNRPLFNHADKGRFCDKAFPLFRALRGMGWQFDVVSEVGSQNGDPVDFFILINLTLILQAQMRGELQEVAVVSHDHCYARLLREILEAGGVVRIVGFREELAPDLLGLEAVGGEILDLEHDIGAMPSRLPRPTLPLYSVE